MSVEKEPEEDEVQEPGFNYFFFVALLQFAFLLSLQLAGCVGSVLLNDFQPLFLVNLLHIPMGGTVVHLVREYQGDQANLVLFLISAIYTASVVYWLAIGLYGFTSGGALNSGDRTFVKIFTGVIRYNQVYFRACFVNPYSPTTLVARHVLGSVVVGLEAFIFVPRMLYLFLWKSVGYVKKTRFAELFRTRWVFLVPKFLVFLALLLDIYLAVIYIVANFPPLFVFMDSPNALLFGVFVYFLVMDFAVLKERQFLVFVCSVFLFANLLSLANMHNEQVLSGTSWLNKTGYYYDLAQETRVGGFCTYDDGADNKNSAELLKFSELQFAYHVTNILYCVLSAALIPFLVFIGLVN